MEIDKLTSADKLFLIYHLTMSIEKNKLSQSEFNDISVNDLHIIHMLYLDDTLTGTQLAKLMSVSKPALSSSIDKLEKKGYLYRSLSNQDRRVYNIRLTKKGIRLSELHNADHINYINFLLKDCTENDIHKLDSLLNDAVNSLNQELKKEDQSS